MTNEENKDGVSAIYQNNTDKVTAPSPEEAVKAETTVSETPAESTEVQAKSPETETETPSSAKPVNESEEEKDDLTYDEYMDVVADGMSTETFDTEEEALEEIRRITEATVTPYNPHGEKTLAQRIDEDPAFEEMILSWIPGTWLMPTSSADLTKPMTDENYKVDNLYMAKSKVNRAGQPTINVIPALTQSIYSAELTSIEEIYNKDELMTVDSAWKIGTIIARNTAMPEYDYYESLARNPNARWRNGIEIEPNRYRTFRRPPASTAKARNSTNNALALIKSNLNMGVNTELFLPHTGISVTIRPPTISEFVELERKIADTNLKRSRRSRGLMSTGDTTFVTRAIIDLFLNCIVSCSVQVEDFTELKNLISVFDAEAIAWLLLCSRYPNGLFISHSCFADPDTCRHTWTEIVNLDKLYIVDNNKLHAIHRDQAVIGKKAHAMTEVDNYQNSFDYKGKDRFSFSNQPDYKTVVYLKNPTLAEAEVAADVWFNMLEYVTDSAYNVPLVGRSREEYLLSQQLATRALAYLHFVDRIELVDTQTVDLEDTLINVIDQEADIIDILKSFSADPLRLREFLINVQEFINAATVSIVAVPNVACPSCGRFHEGTSTVDERHHVIPLDVVSLFIHLCQQQSQNYRLEAEALARPRMSSDSNEAPNDENTPVTENPTR